LFKKQNAAKVVKIKKTQNNYFAISLKLSVGPVSSNLVQVLPINFSLKTF